MKHNLLLEVFGILNLTCLDYSFCDKIIQVGFNFLKEKNANN